METRELRYFVAVAEELHFGRAADRLGIAQPPLSRAIAQLERRLGTVLLARSSRSTSLTEAGQVLLREARAALSAVEAAERRTRRVGRAGPGQSAGLVLATKSGASSELLAKLLDAYAAEPDAVAVDVQLCGIGEQGPMLRDGRADVALLHLPHDSVSGLDVEVLAEEDQLVLLPAGHDWTGRASVTTAEVETLTEPPPARWPRPDGTYPDGDGPEVRDHTQLLQLVALGRTWVVLPESARSLLREGIVAVPISDAPRVTTVIAWPPHSRSAGVASLVRTALRL